jgi:hypothetical protein
MKVAGNANINICHRGGKLPSDLFHFDLVKKKEESPYPSIIWF